MTAAIRAGRRTVHVARPGKVLFPCGLTKADLARYYATVAPVMLPHIAGRPLNLERYPGGIDGPRILQQRAGEHFPAWIRRVTVAKRDGAVTHVAARDAATLVYLADQACITLHAWLSRADRPDRPDRLVFDLDPGDDAPPVVRGAARALGALLRELGLEPFVMTTGSRGLHVVVPLVRRWSFGETRRFARDVARIAVARDGRLTLEHRKAARRGRIFVDVMRNAYGHTAVAPYSVRARPGAPVAAPLRWEELGEPATTSRSWTLRTVPGRLEAEGDPWVDIRSAARTLTRAQGRVETMLAEVGLAS